VDIAALQLLVMAVAGWWAEQRQDAVAVVSHGWIDGRGQEIGT
jgi:hypothetical protein